MSEQFQNQYRIASSRASWHGYNGGVYFVTICTSKRSYYLGDIVVSPESTPQMQLSTIGQFAQEQFENVKQHYPYAEIPLFVVMPNHIHAVVVIDCRDGVHPVSTGDRKESTDVNKKMQDISNRKGLLSVVIGGIKRSITHFAHQNDLPFAWQTRFHDRIIRNQNELNRIAEYVENNVAKWSYDKLNPSL